MAFASWGLSSPVGSSPDDDFHLASIWCSSSDTQLCRDGTQVTNRYVSTQLSGASCFAYKSEDSASCQTEQLIFESNESELSERGNFSGLYPQVFYATMHLFAGEDVQLSTIAMRLFNAILFTVLLGVLLVLSNPVNKNKIFIAQVITLVPLGMFLIPSTNPSSWAFMGLIFSAFALVLLLKSKPGIKRKLLSVYFLLTCLIASGARGDAGAYLVLIIAVGVAIFWNDRSWKTLLVPLAGAIISGLLFLSTKQSSVSTSGLAMPVSESSDQVVRSAFSVFGFNLLQLPELWAGVFGYVGLGWLDTRLPAITWVSALAVFCAVLFVRLRGLTPREYIGLAILGFSIIAIPMYVLQISGSHVGENVQPRYIYPLIAAATALAILTNDVRRELLGKAQTVIVFVSIVLANSFALYTNLSRYIQGQGWGTNWNLNEAAFSGWWWESSIPPMTLWFIGSLAFAAAFSPLIWNLRTSQSVER